MKIYIGKRLFYVSTEQWSTSTPTLLRAVGLLSEDERLREGFVLLLESMRRQWASGNSSRIGKKICNSRRIDLGRDECQKIHRSRWVITFFDNRSISLLEDPYVLLNTTCQSCMSSTFGWMNPEYEEDMLSLPFTSKRLPFLRVVFLFPPLLRLPGFERILNLNQSFSRGVTLWSSNEPKLLPGTGDAGDASPLV